MRAGTHTAILGKFRLPAGHEHVLAQHELDPLCGTDCCLLDISRRQFWCPIVSPIASKPLNRLVQACVLPTRITRRGKRRIFPQAHLIYQIIDQM